MRPKQDDVVIAADHLRGTLKPAAATTAATTTAAATTAATKNASHLAVTATTQNHLRRSRAKNCPAPTHAKKLLRSSSHQHCHRYQSH